MLNIQYQIKFTRIEWQIIAQRQLIEAQAFGVPSEKCLIRTRLECETALDSGVNLISKHKEKIIYAVTDKIILSCILRDNQIQLKRM